MTNKKYRYVSYKNFVKRRTKIILVCLMLLFAVCAGSSTLILQQILKSLPPKDKEMSINLAYLTPDANFGEIDYSGIEYFLDGVSYLTTSDTISMYFNDYDAHNFTMYFGGEEFYYNWTGSFNQLIELSTKSLTSTIIWDEIGVIAINTAVDLYFNGVFIETGITDASGLITFNNLNTELIYNV